MIVKPLTEYCTLNMGQSPDSKTYNTQGNGLPFYQGNADFGESHPVTRVWCSDPVKVAEDGDILISVRAPIGAMNMAVERCCIGRGLAALTPISNKCSKQFLYYALQSKVDSLIAQGTGSTFKAISKKVLEATCIPAYSTIEQEQIAETIGRVDNTIAARRNQLVLLDQLVKSRFIELFGTIHDNRFGFSVVTLQDVSAPIKDGTHQTPIYTTDAENGYKFLSSKDVTTGKVDWSHLKYIPEELHRELYARISPRKGDILLAKNGTTGIAAIVDRDEVFDIYVSLALIRPHGVDSTYLWAAINAAETKQQFDASLKGIGVPNLHLGEIKKARIILPPMELQEQFAAFVEQTDKSKLAVQKGLQELEILKKSLMQQYFG